MAIVSNILKRKLADGDVDLATADIRSLLVDNTHVPDPDVDFVTSIVGDEIAGASYARKTLANKAVTRDDANDFTKITGDDRVWVGADFGSPEYEVFFVQVTDDTDSYIGWYSLIRDSGGAAITTNGGDLTLTQHPTNGLLRLA